MYQINVADVTHVLLNRWLEVTPGTFDIDTYQFVDSSTASQYPVGVESLGFSFTTPDGSRVTGPISAIRAVKHSG